MSDATQEVFAQAANLGINLDSQEESSSTEVETESMEAEGETASEEVNPDLEVEGNQEAETEISDEDASATAETKTVEEEPKLTLKQFQELQAKEQEIATKEKAFMERMQAQEKEFNEKYHEKVKVHDQMDDFLAHLAEKDADLFEIIKGEFAEHQKQYSNPVYNSIKTEMEQLRQELGQFKNKASDEVTLTKLDGEMEKFNSTIGKEAEAAGLKVDRKVIEEMWVKGLSVKEAFYAKYGPAFAKASASKAKLATVVKKTEARPAVSTVGTIGKSNTPGKAEVPRDAFDAVNYFASKLTGKKY